MALFTWIILAISISLVTIVVILSDTNRKKQIEQSVLELLAGEWVCDFGGKKQVELPFESELPRESKAFSRQVPFFSKLGESAPSTWLFGNITERSDSSSVLGNSIMVVKKVEHGPGFSFRIQQRIGGVFEDVRDTRFIVCETVALEKNGLFVNWIILKLDV